MGRKEIASKGVPNEAFVEDDVVGQPQAPLPTPSIAKVSPPPHLFSLKDIDPVTPTPFSYQLQL